MPERRIRLGCAGGYLEGRLQPGLDIAGAGDCDYICLEALNEASLSVLQRARETDSNAGFHAKGVDNVVSLVRASGARTRLITSIGGANPAAGARAVAQRLNAGGTPRAVAYVEGDNLSSRWRDLVTDGSLTKFDGSLLSSDELDGVFAASAYFGAQPIAEALGSEAEVVITGRVVDSALYLGPAIHEFGWQTDDVDSLAGGSLAGHLLECAGHMVGGNYWGPGWEKIDYAQLGHGIADLSEDGTVEVTKLPAASGLVSRDTVLQQMLYEIGDPSAYVLPDVIVDISAARVHEVGPDRMRVENIRGHSGPTTLKVLLSRRAGYIAEGFATFTWPDARLKAAKATEALARRLTEVHGITEFRIDHIGGGGLTPLPTTAASGEPPEITLRVAVAASAEEQAAVVHRELANFYDCAPAGACGISGPTSGSRAAVRDRIDLVPCLVPAELVPPKVTVLR